LAGFLDDCPGAPGPKSLLLRVQDIGARYPLAASPSDYTVVAADNGTHIYKWGDTDGGGGRKRSM